MQEIKSETNLPDDEEIPFEPSETESGLNFDSVTPFEMSYKYYNRLWAEAQAQLENVLKKERPLDEEPEIVSERMNLVRRVSKMYLLYIGITNKMIKCHENIAQPQKRILLRKIADSCIGRVLELKHELVALENSEFHFLDDMLLTLRMVPQDMDVKIPEYFKEKSDEEREYKKTVEHYLNIKSEKEKSKYIVTEREKMVKTAMVYLRLIQTHERTRQAREVFSEYQKRFIMKELHKQREASKENKPNVSRQEAATVIQRAWRKHKLLKSIRREYVAEMNLLGMLPRPKQKMSRKAEGHRFRIIKRNEEEYRKAETTIKNEMIIYKVPRLMEKLEDKIRSYFQDYFVLYGKYPDFPTEEDGGSTKMFETRVDFDTESTNTTDVSEKKPETPKDSQSQKGSQGKKDAKAKKDTKKGKESKSDAPEGYSVKQSNYVADLISLHEEYTVTWLDKELTNFDKFDSDILKENVAKDIEKHVQLVVDEKMRLELERLTQARQKDTKKKAKGKKKGKDKSKKGKGKKERKEKDLTPERTVESLIEELVTEGIIVSYPKSELYNFIGDYNYTGSAQHLAGDVQNDPNPCLGDVRRIINEYCILPMGSQEIHCKGPFVKSLLIAGPKGVGKKSLIYAVCNEIGATLMDLSAENIQGKYPGKEGKEMLLHLILKVGRLLQPTVIFIRDAENYFYKKKPPSCTLSEPGRLKKDLPKFVKNISNEERIMVCGTAVLPFDVDLKGLSDSYNKVICILKPDYNCRRSLWREFIDRNKGILTRKLDMTVLCNVSDGFSADAIETSVKQTLTARRLAFQKKMPLCATDFLPELANHVPIYEEENDAYKQWLEKMPIKKKRLALMDAENEGKEVADESEEED